MHVQFAVAARGYVRAYSFVKFLSVARCVEATSPAAAGRLLAGATYQERFESLLQEQGSEQKGRQTGERRKGLRHGRIYVLPIDAQSYNTIHYCHNYSGKNSYLLRTVAFSTRYLKQPVPYFPVYQPQSAVLRFTGPYRYAFPVAIYLSTCIYSLSVFALVSGFCLCGLVHTCPVLSDHVMPRSGFPQPLLLWSWSQNLGNEVLSFVCSLHSAFPSQADGSF